MASLPTVNDREVLNSLKNQETLLENISRVLVKREEYSSRKDFVMRGDKRTIDDQQEKSTIRKILESFTKMGSTRMNSEQIQLKTFEETKITKNIAQRTGLDIEFIRKSFEEGQKKKDRELLADAIKSAIVGAGNSGKGFSSGVLSGIGGIGSAILTGLKVITGIIGAAFRQILGTFSIAGLTSVFKGALIASGLAFLLKSASTQTDTQEKTTTLASLEKAGPGTEIFERNVQEAARKEYYAKFLEDKPNLKEKYSKESIPGQKKMEEEFFKKILGPDSDMPLVANEYQEFLGEVSNRFVEEHNQAIGKLSESIKDKEQELKETPTDSFDTLLKEGDRILDSAVENISGLANKVVESSGLIGSIGKSVTSSLLSMGSIKDSEGKELFNLFETIPGALSSVYEGAMSEFKDMVDEGKKSGDMNTQVNNTNNVIGSSAPSMTFPNANAVDNHPSVVQYLVNKGTIRY